MISTVILRRRWNGKAIWLLYLAGLLPAAWQFYLGATGNLGADPVKTFELFLGVWAVRFLILTLTVSPLREIFGLNLIRYRRALGLLCFYYVLFHFTVYLVLDQELVLHAVIADVMKRPFIMFGMAGFAILMPLAITSNSLSIRRMGTNWALLHRLVYFVALCGGFHFYLATKVLSSQQYIYLTLISLLLLYRIARPALKRRKKSGIRNQGQHLPSAAPN